MAEEEIKESKISQAQIDKAVAKYMGGKMVTAENMDDLFKAQAEALKRIADQTVPANARVALEKLEADHESPYIMVGDRIGVLFVSTADLASIDGYPGYIEERLEGEYTKQGLPKRIRIPVEPVYQPGLDVRYQFTVMTREEFDEMQGGKGGLMPNASVVAAMSLRAGGAK